MFNGRSCRKKLARFNCPPRVPQQCIVAIRTWRSAPPAIRQVELKQRKSMTTQATRKKRLGAEIGLLAIRPEKTPSNKHNYENAHDQALRYTSVTPSRSGNITFSTRSSARIASPTLLYCENCHFKS